MTEHQDGIADRQPSRTPLADQGIGNTDPLPQDITGDAMPYEPELAAVSERIKREAKDYALFIGMLLEQYGRHIGS